MFHVCMCMLCFIFPFGLILQIWFYTGEDFLKCVFIQDRVCVFIQDRVCVFIQDRVYVFIQDSVCVFIQDRIDRPELTPPG